MNRIHVVSLARSGRRASIAEALDRTGAPFRFEDAVDARALPRERLEALYDDRAAFNRYGRSMTPAEVACFVSHRNVWQKIAESGEAAVVLEDDALLDPQHVFEQVLRTPGDQLAGIADVVLLGRSKLRRSAAARMSFYEPLKRSTLIDGLRIGIPFKQWTSGAVGYWISADAARRALERNGGRIGVLLDDWPYHRDEGGLRVAELRPYAVWEAFETMPSSIDEERRALTAYRGMLGEIALKPLRLIRTAGRWLVVAGIRLRACLEKIERGAGRG